MLAENIESMKEFADYVIMKSERMMGRADICCASDTSLEELCTLSDVLLEMGYSCKFSFERLNNGEIAIYAETTDLREID